jgi:hypothetical protein
MFKLIPILALLLSISGCATYETKLANDKGQAIRCHTSGMGLISSVMASSIHEDCVKEAKEKGYN